MIISNIRREQRDEHILFLANISWEQTPRPAEEYYFRVPVNSTDATGNLPDAFLCAGLIPALSNGEERILVESPVCPSLKDNLQEALFWITTWYKEKYEHRKPLRIDADRISGTQLGRESSSLFMSGGLDSCFSLYHNVREFPEIHPGRVRTALFINGFDIGGRRHLQGLRETQSAYEHAISAASKVCRHFGVSLIPIDTNIRHLDDTPGFWGREFCGAALAACAHAVGAASRLFYLSSDGEPISESLFPVPFGNNPCITPCYSSYRVQLRHYLTQYDSRSARLAAIADTPVLMDNLRVCYHPPADRLNCGQCEKCVRTMLGLEALGKLDRCNAFTSPLSVQLINEISIQSDVAAVMFKELLEHFQMQGRHDFAAAIKGRLAAYETYQAWKNETNWKGRIKKLDRRYFGNTLNSLFK